MNLLFCGDKNVANGIFLSSMSICKNVSEPIEIYILTADITVQQKHHLPISQNFCRYLEQEIKNTNPLSRVHLIDITQIFDSYLPSANMNTRFTPLCMLRLFADLVSEIPDKILYLDTDVLCRKDFCDFYNTNIDNAEIVGVPDRYGKWFFGNILKHDYINSGVLLMNMKNIRRSGLFKKCRDLCKVKKMFMPDQTALNKLAIKIKVNRRYNEQSKIKSDTVFKHFTTYFSFVPYFHSVTIKPWDIEQVHTKLKIYEFDDILQLLKENDYE